MNNSMNLIYSDINSFSTIPQNKKYIMGVESNLLRIDNRFLNNKTSSNYTYNTINGNKIQDHIQLATVTPINNHISKKNSNSNINYKPINYILNNNDLNLGNQKPLNESNKFIISSNPNILSFKSSKSEMGKDIPNKNLEIATVTKISSIHSRILSENSNKINKKNLTNIENNPKNINIKKINNQTNNPKESVIENQIIKNKKIIVNKNLNQSEKGLNTEIPQPTDKLNKNKVLNNITNDSKNAKPQDKPKLMHKSKKKILVKEGNKKLNKTTNTNSNTNKNLNILISPKSQTSIPPSLNKKLISNYKVGTNTILTLNNINNDSKSEKLEQKKTANKTPDLDKYNIQKLEKPIIINKSPNKTPKKTLKKKKKKSKDRVNIKYSDFVGNGYVKNYSGVTRPGRDIAGNMKINQDTLIILTNINNIKDFNLFGVLDGHGPDGHFVSEYISNYIPSQLVNHPEIKKLSDTEKIYKKFKEKNCEIITQIFKNADKELEKVTFNAAESGTTCCLVIHIGKHILCANTGDSRALITFDESKEKDSKNLNYLQVVPLSIDYKPELPEETARIIKSGGVVEQMADEFGLGVGPLRVWAKDEDYPGLAMSRSIGDLKGKKVGVIHDPGIFEYDLNRTTKFVIICSDGVWEYLNNDIVKEIGKKFYLENNPSGYCHFLLSHSFNEWLKHDNFVDDITAVTAFF